MTYKPSHGRDDSDPSSIYSEARHSRVPKTSDRESMIAPLPFPAKSGKGDNRKTLLPSATGDNRYSEIYDAYYRNSMIQGGPNVAKPSRTDAPYAGGKPSAGMAM